MAPSLSLLTDSGSSNADRVTNVATINVSGLEAGASWEYQVDSGAWTKGTGSSFAATSGTHTYAVRQTDAAGNLGTASAATSITLDTTGPALSMSLRTDSGSSTSDFVTNDPVVNVSNLEAGRPWQYSLDGGTTWSQGFGSSFTLNKLLTNGDFSAGNTGFISESTYASVGTSTIPVWYMGVKGGVGGAGDNFLSVSGESDPTKIGWAQDVSLVKGVNYTFSYYAATNNPPAQLQVYVGGVAVGTASQLVSGADWALVTVSFTATTTGMQQLAIKDLVTVASGNDYVLDGMSLSVDATYAANMIKVRQSDVAGNETVIGNSQSWTIDTTPPLAPTTAPSTYKDDIGSIQNPSSIAPVTDDTLPSLNITKNLTDTVNLYVDGAKVASVYDAINGTLTPVTPLGAGLHTFAYSLSDKAGNESATSPTMNITIDLTAPAVLTNVVATDDIGAITGTINNNAFTDDTKPTFSGKGTAGDVVKVYDGVTVIGSTTVIAGGTWSFTPVTALNAGVHTITTTATDPAGNESASSTPLTFTVDTTAPVAPSLSLLTDSGSSNTDRVTNVATVNVSGLEAGATWEYRVDSGAWTKGTGSSFAATSGTHTYAVRQSDAAGNLGTASVATSITLDTTAPALSMSLNTDSGSSNSDFLTNDPVVNVSNLEAGRPWQYSLDGGTSWLEGYGSSFTLNNLLVNGDFSAGKTGFISESVYQDILTTPPDWQFGITTGLGGPGDKFLLLDSTDATKIGWGQNVNLVQGVSYTFSFYAATNFNPAKLQVYLGGVAVGAPTQLVAKANWTQVKYTFTAATTGLQQLAIKDLVTDAMGNDYVLDGMSLVADASILAGSVKVRQSDLAGNETIASNAQTWTLDVTPPTAPSTAPANYNDNVGAVTNASSIAATTDDTLPGINVGKALTDTPSLYVNGAKVAATYDSANGTLTPVTALTDGLYTFAYSLTDKAGNESAPSPTQTITIDTAAPATPGVVVATDDVGAKTGVINAGATTDDTKPTFSGSGAVGDVIRVYDGTTLLGSTTVVAGGTWSFTPASPLAEGSHSVTTTATDAAGNLSASSAAFTFTVDITAPVAPTAAPTSYKDDVGAITNASSTAAVTDDTLPGINITKGLTDTVNLYVDGAKVNAQYDAVAGTLTPVTPLGNGLHTFAYSLSDAAGNESAKTSTLSITIDTVAPLAPTTAPTSYKDDVGAITNASSTAAVTDDNKPGINITKALTDTVNLYVDGVMVKSFYDAAAGTLTPLSAVPDGAHNFTYSLSDAAGNESAQSGKLAITIDTAATSNATVGLGLSLLGDVNNDSWVNASEMGTATTLTSKATFNASAVAGDKILFKATNNGVALPDQIATLTATDIANKYVSVSFAKPAEGTVQVVTAAYMDAAGNVATDAAPSDSVRLDTVAPGAPAIHGMILSSEYSTTAVPMYVSLPSNAAVGDKISVTMTNKVISTGVTSTPYTALLTVQAADLVAGQIGFSVPGTNFSKLSTSQFSADIVDAAGNVSVKGYAAPAAPTIGAANVDNDLVAFFDTSAQIMPDATRAARSDYADLYDYATIDTTLKLQGNVNANETVYLYDNGVQIGTATNSADVSNQGLQSWGFSGTFAPGDHKITAKSVNAAGVSSDVSTLFTFTVQNNLPTVDFTNFTGTTYSAKNAVSDRVTIMVDDVLNLPNALTVLGDVADTVVLAGIHSDVFNAYANVLSGYESEYVKHVQGVNGQAGSWQFDLDGSGTMDLLVSDTIHRMILA